MKYKINNKTIEFIKYINKDSFSDVIGMNLNLANGIWSPISTLSVIVIV